jgi:hypothetical protein
VHTSSRYFCQIATVQALSRSTAMAPLLNPVAIPDGFEWTSDRYHLTYPGHILPSLLLPNVRQVTSTPLLGHSVCLEVSEEGYEHTHIALLFGARLRLKGARKFDIAHAPDDANPGAFVRAHPHVMPKVTMLQMQQLVVEYHSGRKYSPTTGKLEYTAPVLHEKQFPFGWEWLRASITELVAAPSLAEACVAGAVRPRSVSDVKLLRAAAAKAPKIFQHKFSSASFKTILPDPPPRVIWMYGDTQLGKTKYACSLFENPLVVKPFDSVGCLEYIKNHFDSTVHDGLVLDEANLRFLTRSQAIAFCDSDEDCVMSVRFTHLELSCTVPRIFVSNPPPGELLPADEFGAIARRIYVQRIMEPTWLGAAPPPVARSPLVATPVGAPPGPVNVYRAPAPATVVHQNLWRQTNNLFASPPI